MAELWLTENGEERVVRALIAEKGIEINSRDEMDETPLSLAVSRGYEGTIEALLAAKGIDVDSKDIYSRTPISRAAARGHYGIVIALLATNRADVHWKDRQGYTALQWATERNHDSIAALLAEVSATPETHGDTSWVKNEQSQRKTQSGEEEEAPILEKEKLYT